MRREWIDRLRPIGVGWHSVVGSYNSPRNEFHLKPSAQRWEGGSFNMAGLLFFWGERGIVSRAGAGSGVTPRSRACGGCSRFSRPSPAGRFTGRRARTDRSAIVVLERAGVDPDKAGPSAAGPRDRRLQPEGTTPREPAPLQQR